MKEDAAGHTTQHTSEHPPSPSNGYMLKTSTVLEKKFYTVMLPAVEVCLWLTDIIYPRQIATPYIQVV